MKQQPIIRFHITYATHRVVNDVTKILLFGRTINGQKICAVDEFSPYFYVKCDELPEFVIDKIKKLQTKKLKVVHVDHIEARFYGKDTKVFKVYVNDPVATPIFGRIINNWEFVKEVIETDINVVRKYFMDMNIQPLSEIEITGEPATLKLKVPGVNIKSIKQYSDDRLDEFEVLGFEVQTYNPKIKENPILMISFFKQGYKKTITWKIFPTDDRSIEFVNSEADLIQRFKEVIDQHKPDILAGWSSDEKALQYIIRRAKKYRIRLDIGMDYSELRSIQKNATTTDITGIVHIDVKKFQMLRTDKNYTIEDAEKLIGKKEIIGTEEISQVWEKTPDNLERYCTNNIRYAEIAYDICIEILPDLIERVRITNQQMFAVSRMNSLNLVEWFLITYAKETGELIPRRRKTEKDRYRYPKLYLPKPGIYEKVVVFDLSNLYASVVSSHNISVETVDCDCCEEGLCSKHKGFISVAIENLLSRKRRLLEIMKSNSGKKITARLESIQSIIEQMYRYLSYTGSRWYSQKCIDIISNIADKHVEDIIEKISENVLYSDGEKLIVERDGKTIKDIRYAADQLNINLPGDIEIVYEGKYIRAIIPGGRKHALLGKDGTIIIRGFFNRSLSKISIRIIESVIKDILEEKDPKLSFQKKIKDLDNQPVRYFAIRTMLTRNLKDYEMILPHVKAAILMKEEGKYVSPGTIVEYVIVRGNGNLRDKVKLVHNASDIDTDYYLNNQILPTVEQLFELIGTEIKTEKDKRLESYF